MEARQAMEEGRILYAGKYNAPDYELIYGEGCDLAVESTMIYHSPEVRNGWRSWRFRYWWSAPAMKAILLAEWNG